MADPRTKLDIIYQEVLGEVSELVGRVEAATERLAEASELAGRAGERSAEQIHQVTAAAAAKLKAELEHVGDRLLKQVETVAEEAGAAASVVHRSARRFATLALAVGLAGGVIGGALAGWALSGALL
ncbi:hypothetical protein [Denitromonas sp.]|jgi:hypothetical protein|uniref:hypothetical protein n=1 Tax=Denitromonas sp. TaxID=2734609 RepID=UPI002AFDDDBD|nr:hypothetical protein [Denitromonas sp.]